MSSFENRKVLSTYILSYGVYKNWTISFHSLLTCDKKLSAMAITTFALLNIFVNLKNNGNYVRIKFKCLKKKNPAETYSMVIANFKQTTVLYRFYN